MLILLSNILYGVAVVLNSLIWFLLIMLIVRAVASWVNADPYNPIVRFLDLTTEPLVKPFRRFLKPIGGVLDLAPLALLLALIFIQAAVVTSLMDYSRVLNARAVTQAIQAQ